MADVKPVPEGFHTITPHLVLDDAAKAIDWYKEAFGAEEICRMPGPGGAIMHAEIRIGDSVIMLGSEWPGHPLKSPASAGTTTVSLAIYCADCDAAFKKAVAVGARAEMPPQDMFWGDRYSKVTDPFGHSWEISTHKEDLSPEEIGRRGAEAMKHMGGECGS